MLSIIKQPRWEYSSSKLGCGLKRETLTTESRYPKDYIGLQKTQNTIAEEHVHYNGPVYRPSVGVEFETWAKRQLIQGEEFLMQWLAGWGMIQSFNKVWKKPQNNALLLQTGCLTRTCNHSIKVKPGMCTEDTNRKTLQLLVRI